MVIGIIIGVVVLIVAIVIFMLISKGGNILNNLKHEAWNKIDESLGSGFVIKNQIVVRGVHYHRASKEYLPNTIVSIDTEHEKIAVTRIVSDEKNEKGVITKYILGTDFISFKSILDGELVLGGKKSSSTTSTLGGVTNIGLVSASSTSSTEEEYRYVHYILKLNDIANPIYTIILDEDKTYATSSFFKGYMDAANKIDSIVKNIIANNK